MDTLKKASRSIAKATKQTAQQTALKEMKKLPLGEEVTDLVSALTRTERNRRRRAKRKQNKQQNKKIDQPISVQALPSNVVSTIIQPESIMTRTKVNGGEVNTLVLTQQIGPLKFYSADYGGTDYKTDPYVMRLWEFRLSPLDATYLKALATKAIGYQNWNVKGVRVNFAPSQPVGTTSGNVSVAVITDVTEPLTVNWSDFTSKKGAVTGQIAAPFQLDLAQHVKMKYSNDSYRIDYPPDRSTAGVYEQPGDQASLNQIVPLSILLATQGFRGDVAEEVGTVVFQLEVEFRNATQPDNSLMASIAGTFDVDIEHTISTSDMIFPPTSWFRTSNRRIVYLGYGEQTYDVDATLVVDSSTPVDLVTWMSVKDITGATVPGIPFDYASGTATDGRLFYHLDGTMTLARGTSIIFDNISFIGKFSLYLEPRKGAISSLLS